MLKLPDIFQDGMVLQYGKKVCIWGISSPFQKIEVEIQGWHAESKADGNGNWKCYLSPLVASYKERLSIRGDGEQKVIEDVAVGEVWIGAGQSNMEFPLRYEKHRAEENGRHAEDVRFFDVPEIAFDGQQEAFDYHQVNIWRKATAEDLDYFSAAGYYFAKEMKRKLGIPVAVIGCNWGGTMAEVWMKKESAEKYSPEWMQDFVRRFENINMEAYWKAQKDKPWNDHGSVISEFNDIVLAKTVTENEFVELFGDAGETNESLGGMNPENFPGALYEYMVKRIAPYTVQGVLWYQGESNDTDQTRERYKDILTALIDDWREIWGETLPFLVVQLPGMENWVGLENFGFDVIRKKQQEVADTVDNVWLCSISDVGERWDIHPKDKKAVGMRLAWLALGHVHGKEILCDAPRLINVSREKHRVICTFEHAGEGLYLDESGELPLHITKDGEEIAFQARVRGNELLLDFQENVTLPITLSLAQEKWFCMNLFNSAGIPAVPFEYEMVEEGERV